MLFKSNIINMNNMEKGYHLWRIVPVLELLRISSLLLI